MQRRRRCFVYPQRRKPEAEVIFVCFDVVRRLGCQLSPDGWSRPHQRWREVIRHHFGISPAMRGDGGRAGTSEAGEVGVVFGPPGWIMQPSVRSAHCPLLDFLISSVTITHLLFAPALTPNLPRRNAPSHHPPTLCFSEKHCAKKEHFWTLGFSVR